MFFQINGSETIWNSQLEEANDEFAKGSNKGEGWFFRTNQSETFSIL